MFSLRHIAGLVKRITCTAFVRFSLIWLLFLILSGCASLPTSRFPDLEFKTRARALSCEDRGELRQALYHWRILHGLLPEDRQAEKRIESLSHRLKSMAREHYLAGLELQREGNLSAAGNEFIEALAADPADEQAFTSLQRITRPASINYQSACMRIAPEPTARDVKRLDYSSSTRREPIRSPGLLKLWITKAECNLELEQYEKSLAQVKRALLIDPGNPDALRIKEMTIYREGKRELQQGNLSRAIKLLSRLNPDYRDVDEIKSLIEKQLADQKKSTAKIVESAKIDKEQPVKIDKEKADLHYKQGLKYFLKENLEQAIKEWELALKYNPRHSYAAHDLADARRLQVNLNNIK